MPALSLTTSALSRLEEAIQVDHTKGIKCIYKHLWSNWVILPHGGYAYLSSGDVIRSGEYIKERWCVTGTEYILNYVVFHVLPSRQAVFILEVFGPVPKESRFEVPRETGRLALLTARCEGM